MDRGTKLMFGAMTVAICLMAFNMVGGKSPEANASMNAGYDYRGGTEPTIVWYQIVQGSEGASHPTYLLFWVCCCSCYCCFQVFRPYNRIQAAYLSNVNQITWLFV